MRFLVSLLFVLISLPAFAESAVPQKWDIVEEKSTLAFTWKQSGAPATGTFKKFSAEIFFDPDNLADSRVTAEIDIASIDTGYDDRDQDLKSATWFDAGQFPAARFVSTAFRKTDAGYEVDGNLTIREVSVPLSLPFTLTFAEDASGKTTALMKGSVMLERLKFGLGQGEWAETGVIANEVDVEINLLALPAQDSFTP